MSNTWFQFRQFRIAQDHCAMKVSTDACIQGAWTPIPEGRVRALDIGCGTGLLSLMLAQRNSRIQIDAVEIDPDAAQQAVENCAASPFAGQINVVHADVREWGSEAQYDLVICNPPFFSNSLKGDTLTRNLARHDSHFDLRDMAAAFRRLLHAGGYAAVLLPDTAQPRWEQQLSESGLYLYRRLSVQPFAHSRINRIVSLCGKIAPANIQEESLVIYESPGQYTPAFTDLLRPYYLYL